MANAVDEKLLRQTKFPPEFNQKVDMRKVNIEVMKKWIAGKISEILGAEDDVVIELCFNLLEGSRFPNIKVLQIQLTGFLEKDTAAFCKELWTLCLSAQSNAQGVPKELLEAKKLELIQEKIETERAAEAARRHREQERNREREVDRIRQRERTERGDRNSRTYGRGSRDGRDFDRRQSPEGHARPSKRRGVDTYIPGSNSRNDDRHRNRPSHDSPPGPPARGRRERSDSRSSSRSPPRQRQGGGSRHAESERNSKRGDDRARHESSERSRSRSPRPRHRRSRRSPSTSSDSTAGRGRDGSPRTRKRGRASSESDSSSVLEANPRKRRNEAREERRSASPEEINRMQSSADVIKGQREKLSERDSLRPPVRSRSRSPRRRADRRPSLDRYEPRAKRPRNTSSEESVTSSPDKASESP